ncbi:MAG: T9SS type A sorting domain-containing protein [Candidatus Marinimicrobia bacterium]|nr:T9SS type A sorting domain-containing protein [Candidatus Neomarinimicrobiota bacterium]
MMRRIAISILIILPFILFAFDKSNVSINSVYHTSQRLKVNPVSGAVKICALRVSFPEDDNDATTGTGKFLDSGTLPCDDFQKIDPPPHSSPYFKDHIRSAANYFYHVSKGHAVIDTVNSEVYPLIDSLTFQVSQKMDYYHPFLQEDSIDVRLARLFHESVLKADSAGVDFSQYDIVIIFHAGVGQDFDLFLDPTPYDIPSAYLNLNDFRMAFAPDNPNYEGIAVENSSYFIKEGIILPETQNHLLFPNWEDVFGGATSPCEYQIGLNGTFAFMMGFYWGLPSLYDTETGETGIGKFGLMDQGSANLNGLVPAVPSAWSRVFLGWEDPVVAGVDQIINLRHVETSSDSLVWKVPINDYEYFLIENRYASVRPGVSLDSIQYRIYLENGEDEWPSIFPLIVDSIGAVFSEETGVLLSVSRYDVGLPGSGLLIWHIDESVINPNLSANRINVNRERRGVDLEEGDGAQDLGYPSQMLGASVDIGWFFDPWFAGNEGFWHLNPDYPEDEEKRVGFTDYTNPSSKSNDWAFTGIVVDSIGPADKVMNFKIKKNNSRTIFTFSGLVSQRLRIPIPIDLDSTDLSQEFIVIADSIYLFDSEGNLINSVYHPPFSNSSSISLPVVSQTEGGYYLYSIYTDYDSIQYKNVMSWRINPAGKITQIGKISLEDINRSSNLLTWGEELLFCGQKIGGDKTNQLFRYIPTDTLNIDKIFLPSRIFRLIGNKEHTFGFTHDGIIYSIHSDPFTINEIIKIPDVSDWGLHHVALGYLNENNIPDIVMMLNFRLILLLDPGSSIQNLIERTPSYLRSPGIVLSDIDGDNRVEIISYSSDGIYAFTDHLKLEANFPISIPNQYIGKTSIFDHILTTDIDGDGILDILLHMFNVGDIAFNYTGEVIKGFPMTFDNPSMQSSILINSISGTVQIAYSLDRRHIILTKISSEYLSENAWSSFSGGPDNDYFYKERTEVPVNTSGSLLNKKKTFNWPNPTKNNRTAIWYFPTADCNIAIDIYDLAGDLMKSFKETSPLINDYNEIEWNVSNVESGVYFAVVKATSGSKIDSKIVKIMVIK